MEDLFAMEEASLPASEAIVLVDSRSYEDPVLLADAARVLANILDRREEDSPHGDYFGTVQTEVKPHMRKIVSDWMLEVCEEQQCQSEVFSLAVNYMDRFLSRVNISKGQFQLLACVCIFLASKFKETAPVPAENLVVYTDNSVNVVEIIQWELVVLDVLGWELSAVTAYSVLDHLLRSSVASSEPQMSTVRRHAETFVALAATEHAFVGLCPAVVAAACLGSALAGLRAEVDLEDVVRQLSNITRTQEDAIRSCMDQIEISIKRSMSGLSFKPAAVSASCPPPAAPVAASKPKVIMAQQQKQYYSQSTTPTDLMDVAVACVY